MMNMRTVMAYDDEEDDDDDYRVRKRKADAEKAEFGVMILKGQYVKKSEVEKEAFARGRVLRDNLMNIPDRIASILAHETDEKVVHQKLTTEVRQVLEALSDDRVRENSKSDL